MSVYLIDRVLKIVFFRVRVHRVVVHHLPSFRHQVFANSYDDRNAVLAGHVRVVLLWHAGFAKRFIRLEFHAFVLTFFFSYLHFGKAEVSLSVRGITHTRNVSISIKKYTHILERRRARRKRRAHQLPRFLKPLQPKQILHRWQTNSLRDLFLQLSRGYFRDVHVQIKFIQIKSSGRHRTLPVQRPLFFL